MSGMGFLPGQTPQPWYNISLPFAVQRIAVHTELFRTAERVEVKLGAQPVGTAMKKMVVDIGKIWENGRVNQWI